MYLQSNFMFCIWKSVLIFLEKPQPFKSQPNKMVNTLKQVRFTILWGWRLKG